MTDANLLPYLSGWERTILPGEKIAAFQRDGFTIHLIGKRDIRLTGKVSLGKCGFMMPRRK